ncbi:MAG: FecR domain-containing protein, partial [Acidobacteria bacterium]|nr:FecR domain-containing protein [Acidobacteriota bacterium]
MKHAPRSRFPWSGAFVAALVLLASGPALAQREGTSYLSYVGTEVSLVSTNEDDTTARLNMPILAGDRLSTGAGSRAEAVLADGNILRFDTRTDVRFDRLANTYQTEDERTLLFLESGALAIDVRFAASRENAPRIDTNDATIVLADRAYVRIDAGRRGTEVYVESGRAEVFGRSGRVLVKAGEYAYVSGSAEVEVDVSAFPRDRFTRFCEERRDRRAPSTRYVSSDYDYEYTDAGFEDYGSWTYVSSWGRNCWRPRVHSGWLPYTSGYWRYSPHGMTWVSYEPWGWLPYHYGTWGYDVGAGWCWIPGASYSPAWVYWSYAPGWVGWCPMGYYGGYYDHYYRSTRPLWGNDGRGWGYAHLSGRVQVGRIDNHGWSYTPTSRLGRRFDVNRDVVRFERTGLTR